jgi:ornithine carbamoyltransferase
VCPRCVDAGGELDLHPVFSQPVQPYVEMVGSSLVGRDLLSISDVSAAEVTQILDLAEAAKAGADLGLPLQRRSIALIFQRPSNRTRVSFEVAITRLGGHPISLFNPEVQLGERESAADISRILDRYVDGIVARLASHRDLQTIAAAATSPVINALTDAEHPCQVLADCMTVREAVGHLTGARVLYIGDGNNVCTSWIYAAALCGIDLRVVGPRGYEPPDSVLERARTMYGSALQLRLGNDPGPALRDADIIYTDVWTSMGQETEQQRRREDFAYLQVNDALVARAPATVKVMHCLPAHRGEEITDSVIDGPQSIVFDQAENRLWVQLALLALLYAGSEPRTDRASSRVLSAGSDGSSPREIGIEPRGGAAGGSPAEASYGEPGREGSPRRQDPEAVFVCLQPRPQKVLRACSRRLLDPV